MAIGRLLNRIFGPNSLFKNPQIKKPSEKVLRALRKNPRLRELHNSLSQSFQSYNKAFGRGTFYQGLKSIHIEGQRPTEERFRIYGLRRLLKKTFHVLDIGSNCGFFSLYVSKFVKAVDGIEKDHYMVEIGNKVKKYLKINNCTFYQSTFEQFKADKKYDFIMSFAVHRRVNYGLEEYIDILHNMLNKHGYLIIESQDIKGIDANFAKEMKLVIVGKYLLLKEGSLKDDGINDRIFMVLRKK